MIKPPRTRLGAYPRTPAFPEYVSGHSPNSAAAAKVLGRYLRDRRLRVPVDHDGYPEPRSYTSFRQAAEEAGRSRICGGIHFDFSDEQAQLAGTDLGDYVYDNFFRPL